MACSSCGSSSSCSCTGTAFYNEADVCAEDNCEKIYEQQFTFAVCPTNSWNVPLCGQAAVLSVSGILGASIGSYLWNNSFGYFQVTAVDTDKETITVTNTCVEGNAAAGTQIPKCTCFIVTDTPADANLTSDLFPYVAVDFTAPANGDCIYITVTTINGLSAGDVISIGTGFYDVDSFLSSTVVKICNSGDGILPGTSVIAKDLSGNYIYPIAVTSSCCVAIAADLATLTADVAAFAADLDSITLSYTASTSGGILNGVTQTAGGGVAFTYINTSITRTARVLGTYVLTVDYTMGAALVADAGIIIETNSNGAGWVNIMPIPSYGTTILETARTVNSYTVPVVYTIAPGATLSVSARSAVDNNGPDTITSMAQYLNFRGLVSRVD